MNGENFYTLRKAEILIEERMKQYNTKYSHSVLGCRPPASETIAKMDQESIMH